MFSQGLPWQSRGLDNSLPVQGAQVQSQVRELRSCMPPQCSQTREKKKLMFNQQFLNRVSGLQCNSYDYLFKILYMSYFDIFYMMWKRTSKAKSASGLPNRVIYWKPTPNCFPSTRSPFQLSTTHSPLSDSTHLKYNTPPVKSSFFPNVPLQFML